MTAMTERQTVERTDARTDYKRSNTQRVAEDAERQKFICVYNKVNGEKSVALSTRHAGCNIQCVPNATHSSEQQQ